MFSSLETIAIIAIIVTQLVIAYHAYRQIQQMNSFLPEGKDSLALKEYGIPADKILELEPSQVVDKRAYLVREDDDVNIERPRDERGRFVQKNAPYPFSGYTEIDEADE